MPITSVDPLLSLKEAAPLLNMSPSTFLRRVADGTFPQPVSSATCRAGRGPNCLMRSSV